MLPSINIFILSFGKLYKLQISLSLIGLLSKKGSTTLKRTVIFSSGQSVYLRISFFVVSLIATILS